MTKLIWSTESINECKTKSLVDQLWSPQSSSSLSRNSVTIHSTLPIHTYARSCLHDKPLPLSFTTQIYDDVEKPIQTKHNSRPHQNGFTQVVTNPLPCKGWMPAFLKDEWLELQIFPSRPMAFSH